MIPISETSPFSVQPRACGEYVSVIGEYLPDVGSAPRVRGIPLIAELNKEA